MNERRRRVDNLHDSALQSLLVASLAVTKDHSIRFLCTCYLLSTYFHIHFSLVPCVHNMASLFIHTDFRFTMSSASPLGLFFSFVAYRLRALLASLIGQVVGPWGVSLAISTERMDEYDDLYSKSSYYCLQVHVKTAVTTVAKTQSRI